MDQLHENTLSDEYLEKKYTLEAVSKSDAGITLLRWLVRLTGWNKSTMSLEDAARRDVWLTIRNFIPVDKLSLIEHHEIREHQLQADSILREMMQKQQEVQLDYD